jgi:anaerobic ribonucleoside-triphosphate reductase
MTASGDVEVVGMFLVCDACGFFYGDVRLRELEIPVCPECGEERAWAFPRIGPALNHSCRIDPRRANQGVPADG